MADPAGEGARRDARERLEAQVFDALGVVHSLSRTEAVELAGFAAGLMAAHLADIAAVDRSDAQSSAFNSLLRLRDEVNELVTALEEAPGAAMNGKGRPPRSLGAGSP